MALIKCPECGTEVSDKAKNCVKCGYPLAEVSNNAESLSENVIKAESAKSTTTQKAQTVLSTKMLLIIAACIIAVVGIVVLTITLNRPALPYGLRAGMTAGEINTAMRENGFQQDFLDDNKIFYKSKTVYGVRTDFSVITIGAVNPNEYLSVKHFYKSLNETQYTTIKDALVKEYGTPKTKFGGGFTWTKGKVEITFDDISDKDPVVSVTFSDFH